MEGAAVRTESDLSGSRHGELAQHNLGCIELEEPINSTTEQGVVDRVVADTMDRCRRNTIRKRKDFLFFRLVRGGNYHLVKQSIVAMHGAGMENEVDWLLNKSDYRTIRYWTSTEKALIAISCGFFKLITGLALFAFCLCPLFYALHMILTNSLSYFRKSLSKECSLPLAFAVFSENPRVVALLAMNAVTMQQEDSSGNNIFHYIADLSIDNPDKALRVYQMLRTVFENPGLLPDILLKQRNSLGLNALEFTMQYGSPRLLNALLHEEGVLKTTIMQIGDNYLNDRSSSEMTFEKQSESDTDITDGLKSDYNGVVRYSLERFDVTWYEQGDVYGRQSFLLQLLGKRKMADLEEEDLEQLLRCRYLRHWISLKLKNNRLFMLMLYCLGIVVTCLFMWYMVLVGGDHNIFPLRGPYLIEMNAVLTSKATEANFTRADQVQMPDFFMHISNKYCTLNVTQSGITLNSCQWEAINILSEKCASFGVHRDDIIQSSGLARKSANVDKSIHVANFLFICFGFYLALDALKKCVFIRQSYVLTRGQLSHWVVHVLTTKLPGSYLDKQLIVLVSLTFCVYMEVVHTVYKQMRTARLAFLDNARILSTMMSFILIVVVIVWIHTLRLLPNLGHFIITTFSMASSMIRFLVVYSFVLLGFSVIFHFTMRDPECPARRMPEFQSLTTTMFETFKLLLGHGDFHYDVNTNAKVAYVVYSVLCILLLLNLIIAVMSAIAEKIMAAPWRGALWEMEQLDASLATEAIVHILTYPFRGWLHVTWLKRCGFLVEPRSQSTRCPIGLGCDVNHRVFIEAEMLD